MTDLDFWIVLIVLEKNSHKLNPVKLIKKSVVILEGDPPPHL